MATTFSRKIITGIERIIALIKSTIDSYHNTNQSTHANGFNHNLTVTGNVTATNGFSTTRPSHLRSIELGYGTDSTSNNGGYIDFHFNGDTSDYTARIIEDASGIIKISPALTTSTATITTANITTANITTTVSNTIKPNNTNYVKIMRDGKVNTALSIEGYNNPLVRIKNKGVDYRNMQVDKGSGYVALSSSNTFAESGEASLNIDANNHYIALDGTDLNYGSFTVDGTQYTGAYASHYYSLCRRYTTEEEQMGARIYINQYETSVSNQLYWLTTNCLLVDVKCQTPINAKDVANKQYVDTVMNSQNAEDELLILKEELYTLKNEMIVFPNGWNTLTLCTTNKAHSNEKTWSSGLYSNEIDAGWRFVENSATKIRSYYFNGELILDVYQAVGDSLGMLSNTDSDGNTSVKTCRISFHKSCFVVLVDVNKGMRLVKDDSSGVPDSQPANSPFFVPGTSSNRVTTPIFVLSGHTIWVSEKPNMLTVCPCFESQPEQPIRVFPLYGYQLLRDESTMSYDNSEYIINANGNDTMESGGSNIDTTNTFITYRGKTYWGDSSIRLMYKKYSGGSFNAEFEVTLRGQRGFSSADETYEFYNYAFLIPISLIKGAIESTVSLGGFGPASNNGIKSCALKWYTPSSKALTKDEPSKGTYYRCIHLGTSTTNFGNNFSLSTIKINISGMYN